MPEQALIEKKSYAEFSRGVFETGRIIKAQLELTYRCNLHCAHCYTDPYNKKEFFPRELSTAEVKRVMDELSELGVLWLNLSGGEALSRPDFFELYDYAHDKGFLLVLFTNGTTLTPRVIERLKARPPFFVDVSVHSLDAAAFDRFTGVRGSFLKFEAGMKRLRASGLPFRTKTLAMDWNKDELPSLKAYVESLGEEFSFATSIKPRLDGDLSSLINRLSPAEIKALEDEFGIWKDDDDACSVARAQLGAPSDALYRCGCGGNSVHVNAWGEVGTCTLEYEVRASVREHGLREAVEKVFNAVKALRYRGSSPCGTCELHRFCEKSPTALRLEEGDEEAPGRYHCDVALDRAERLVRRRLPHPLGRKT